MFMVPNSLVAGHPMGTQITTDPSCALLGGGDYSLEDSGSDEDCEIDWVSDSD